MQDMALGPMQRGQLFLDVQLVRRQLIHHLPDLLRHAPSQAAARSNRKKNHQETGESPPQARSLEQPNHRRENKSEQNG